MPDAKRTLASLRPKAEHRGVDDPFVHTSGAQLEFLQILVEENASIASDVVQVTENLWAVHGYIAVDGDVLMAEFDSYDQATRTLDLLPRRTQRHDEA
jgi:hypothetical protein